MVCLCSCEYSNAVTTAISVSVNVYNGEQLNLTRISRTEMGAYLCIATNGVPPSVSKRIIVDVECKYFRARVCCSERAKVF